MCKTILFIITMTCAAVSTAADWDSDNRSTYRGTDAGGGTMSTVSNNVRAVAVGNAAAYGLSQSVDTILIGADTGRSAARLVNCVGIGTGVFGDRLGATNVIDIAGMIVVDGDKKNFYITPNKNQCDLTAPIAYHGGQLLATGNNVIIGGASNVVLNATHGKIILSGIVEINGATFDGTNITASVSVPMGSYSYDADYDLYVATYGSDHANGSMTDPFRTIDAAVTAAHEGESICVMPGTYDWPTCFPNTQSKSISSGYVISNKYVRIISAYGRDKTFIQGTGSATNVMHGNGFLDNLPLVKGFTITGNGVDNRSGSMSRTIGLFSTMRFEDCRLVMTNDYASFNYNVRPFSWCQLSNCVVYANVSGNGITGTYEMGFAYGCEFSDSQLYIHTDTTRHPLELGKACAFDNCYVNANRLLRTVFHSYGGGIPLTGREACFSNSTVVVGNIQTANYSSQNIGGSLFVGPCLGNIGEETNFRACTANDVTFDPNLRPPAESPYRLWGYNASDDRALVKSAMRWYYNEERPGETRLVVTNGTVHVYSGTTDLGTISLEN